MLSFAVLTIISIFLIFRVDTNYDLTLYLPEDSKTQEGLTIMEEEFGQSTYIELMIDDVDVNDVLNIKTSLYAIDHVISVVWLDDYVDLETIPISYVGEEYLSSFYVDNKALLTIVLDFDTYSIEIDQVVEDIDQAMSSYDIYLRGDSIYEMENRDLASHEMFKIILVIVPIVLLILFITSKSYFDPVIALISLGVAIVINLGTNIFLDDISFITKTMALALQMALSIDYTLFFIHRYHEERKVLPSEQAVKVAFKKTLPAITASALTTIAGFLALLFMRYRIGMDIGLVLSKGILLSYLTTLTLVSVITLTFDKILIKWQHARLIKVPDQLLHLLQKIRIPLLITLIILILGSFYFQNKTTYLYGANQTFNEDSEIMIDASRIDQTFDTYNQMVILIPNDQIAHEIALVQSLNEQTHVLGIETLVTIVDPNIDRSFIDPMILQQFVGNQYTRVIIQTDILEENEEMYLFVDDLNRIVSDIYENDYYILGLASTASEIEDIVTADSLKIMLISMIAIFIILTITFKNPIIPIMLILLIETAIMINVSILYLTDVTTIYIGYLVVMSIQLGATIDYAVLLSTRYLENRKHAQPVDAMQTSYRHTLMTMFVSAIILTVAGFAEGLLSNISTVKEIGYLLGKGSLISLFLTMIFLPNLLLFFDKIIINTSFDGLLRKMRKTN
ncbi:MMPL family transporter [Mycoplasmatota bacterium]|nr:MMPL family transporter [Mycoplasmatota bacterium]